MVVLFSERTHRKGMQLPKRKILITSHSISPKTGIPTLQTSQKFNEATYPNGGTSTNSQDGWEAKSVIKLSNLACSDHR